MIHKSVVDVNVNLVEMFTVYLGACFELNANYCD